MRFRFTTDVYPEGERLDGWREEFGRRVINGNIDRLDNPRHRPFSTHIEGLHMGDVLYITDVGTPVRFSRNKKQAADGDDNFTFMINRRGSMRLSQLDRTVAHEARGVILVDHGRPFEIDALAPPDGEVPRQFCGFAVPRRTLLAAAPGAEGHSLSPAPALLDYLVRYSESMTDLGAASPAILKAMGDHVFDLLVLMTGGTKDAAEIASRRGLRAARLQSILDFIAQNLDNPELDRGLVARHHGVSMRYVARLMEEHGETLSHYVLRLRLDKAAAMLSNPSLKDSRVSDIAWACGFSDLSYFNRAFRRRFGLSPSAYRA